MYVVIFCIDIYFLHTQTQIVIQTKEDLEDGNEAEELVIQKSESTILIPGEQPLNEADE